MTPHHRCLSRSLGGAGLAVVLLTTMLAVAHDAAADALALRAYPLAIHRGTCQQVTADPSFDLGYLVPRPLNDVDIGVVPEDVTYDTGVVGPFPIAAFYDPIETGDWYEAIPEDTDILFGGVDDSGFSTLGLDLDGDSVLDEAEIVEQPFLWVYERDVDDIGPPLVELTVDALRAIPHVLIVHRATAFDTDYLACGEIRGAEDDDDELAFRIRPVSTDGFVGIVEMEEDEGGVLGIGQEGEIEIWAMPSRAIQSSDHAEPGMRPEVKVTDDAPDSGRSLQRLAAHHE